MQTVLPSNAAGSRACAKLAINVTDYGYGRGSPVAGRTFASISVPAKKAAPKGSFFGMRFTPISLFSTFANCILQIAQGVVSRSLRLIELAFGLQFLVACDIASGVLDRALSLVRSALLRVRGPYRSSCCVIDNAWRQ